MRHMIKSMQGVKVLMLICAMTAISMQSFANEKTSVESSITCALSYAKTNTFNTGVDTSKWIELKSMYVTTPAVATTGTVVIQTLRGSTYVNVASFTITNGSAVATYTFTPSINLPVSGTLRIIASQTAASTNAWLYGIFFEDSK